MKMPFKSGFGFISCIFILVVEIIVGYFIVDQFYQRELDAVHAGQTRTLTSINADVAVTSQAINNHVLRNAAIFRLNGKFITPDDYRIYTQLNSSFLADIIHSKRWIPRITLDEVPAYSAFYRPYYDANFTVRDITFDPETRTFTVKPATNRSEYYSFALSDPPFTLTLMGGDVLQGRNSAVFVETLNSSSLISATSRITLSIPNNNIDYGVFLYHDVRTDLPVTPALDFIVPPLPNNSVILGQVAVLIQPSIMVKNAMNLLGIPSTDYDLTIFDLDAPVATSLIYTEPYLDPDTIRDAQYSNGWTRSDLHFFDRTYCIYIRFNEGFNEQFRDNSDEIVLASCIMIFLVIDISAVYIYYSYHKRIAAETNNIYKQLLTYVNHELRNPLVPITGLVDMSINQLKQIKEVDSNGSLDLIISDLHTVQGHTQLMNYIIDDVLTYRKIKEGKVQIRTETILFQDLVHSLRKTVNAKIRENPNVHFDMSIEPDLLVSGDKYRISQILLNLVNNAIKFTNQGTIILRAYKNAGMCEFTVSDTGCGVDPKIKPLLFGEFMQGKPTSSPTVHGSGLGLFICRRLSMLMGGTISYIEPEDGIGAIFCVRLPIPIQAMSDSNSVDDEDTSIRVTEASV